MRLTPSLCLTGRRLRGAVTRTHPHATNRRIARLFCLPLNRSDQRLNRFTWLLLHFMAVLLINGIGNGNWLDPNRR